MNNKFLKNGIFSTIVLLFSIQNLMAMLLETEELAIQNSRSLGKINDDSNNVIREELKQLPHILFLCTGNSCRSQIAEGWATHLGKDVASIQSAGIKAHGINPYTFRIMEESGIDITKQSSKIVTSDMIEWANIVVTVCGGAHESCPFLPSDVRKIHWPIPDPAIASGSDEEIMNQFSTVNNEIHRYVKELLLTLKEEK